jgi:Integrase core domain
LDACIPCQLFKRVPDYEPTAAIHPYDSKEPFQYWQIDFVSPLVETTLGNVYLITAIDYCTGKAIAYPLPNRSAAAAIDMLEEIIWTYGPRRQLRPTTVKSSKPTTSMLSYAGMISSEIPRPPVTLKRTARSRDSITSWFNASIGYRRKKAIKSIIGTCISREHFSLLRHTRIQGLGCHRLSCSMASNHGYPPLRHCRRHPSHPWNAPLPLMSGRNASKTSRNIERSRRTGTTRP